MVGSWEAGILPLGEPRYPVQPFTQDTRVTAGFSATVFVCLFVFIFYFYDIWSVGEMHEAVTGSFGMEQRCIF